MDDSNGVTDNTQLIVYRGLSCSRGAC